MRTTPHLAVLAAAVCFATTGSAVALADVDPSPVAVGALRVLVGGGVLGLVAVLALRGQAREGSGPRPPGLGLAALGALGVLAYQPTFFAGTAANGVAIGTVVALGTAPVATGVLESAVRRRPPGARWAVATAVALAGVVLVSGLLGGAGVGSVDPLGVLASVGAGTSYAVYAVAGKVLLDRGWRPTEAMGSVFGVAALGSVPLLALTATPALLAPRGLALGLWLGLVTTAVAYLLFGWGLARLRATTASTLTLAEPLTATLLGLVVLGERLGLAASAGLVMIALGIAVLTLPARARATGESRAVAPA